MKIFINKWIFPLLIIVQLIIAVQDLCAQSDCYFPAAQIDLDVNNVRARLLTGRVTCGGKRLVI